MDARQLRTRDALTRAIRELASERTVAEITVTDVALRAGISRPTFYAHAASPGALLGTVLGAELQQLREEFDRLSEQSADESLPLERFQAALVEHVYRNAAIYRHNLRHRLPPELRDVLIDHIEWGLVDHLTRHPHIAPHDPELDALATAADAGNGRANEADVTEARYREAALYSAMAASGTVAALETWLRVPDPLHPERAVSAIRRGTAQWWTAKP